MSAQFKAPSFNTDSADAVQKRTALFFVAFSAVSHAHTPTKAVGVIHHV